MSLQALLRRAEAPEEAPAAVPAPAKPRAARRSDGYTDLTGDLWISLVLVLPLLAIYQLGLFRTHLQVLNGVDVLTRYVFDFHGHKGLILLNLGVIAGFLAAIIRLQHDGRFRPTLFPPLILESCLYAYVLIAGVIPRVIQSVPLLAVSGDRTMALTLAIGAGVHEELVFRLLLIGVLRFLFRDMLELGETRAIVLAVVISSALFAGAHYIGPYGDPFDRVTFAFRFLAGFIFAVLYKLRSFAVAVYTHAAYDIYVMVIL